MQPVRLLMARAFVIAQCDEVVELLGVVLKRRGMSTAHYREPARALAALQEEAPEAIIVGCLPPIMTGQRDLMFRISKLGHGVAARTIVLTDSPDQNELATEAHALGIPVVLPMPFDLEELGSALDRLAPKATA